MLGWDLIVEQWDEENKMFSIGCVMPIIQHHKGGGVVDSGLLLMYMSPISTFNDSHTLHGAKLLASTLLVVYFCSG